MRYREIWFCRFWLVDQNFPTIQDFNLHFYHHSESHLSGNGLYPWWALAATFALFCIFIVLLCPFLQLLCRHGGTALLKSMGNSFVEGKIWDHPRVPELGQITWWIVLTKKTEGPFGFARKSRNSRWTNGGGVGAHGQLTQGANFRNPRTGPNTNAQRMSLLSRFLRSPLYTFVQNCCSFLRSL